MSIKSKIHNYGHEKESSWPPRFPREDNKGGHWYIDPDKGLTEGYPPPDPNRGKAPLVIFDSMPAEYHQGAGRIVESRKEWDRLDKEHNTLTFGSRKEIKRSTKQGKKQKEKEFKEDRNIAVREGIQKVRANPKEIREKLQKEGEKQRETAREIVKTYEECGGSLIDKNLKEIIE